MTESTIMINMQDGLNLTKSQSSRLETIKDVFLKHCKNNQTVEISVNQEQYIKSITVDVAVTDKNATITYKDDIHASLYIGKRGGLHGTINTYTGGLTIESVKDLYTLDSIITVQDIEQSDTLETIESTESNTTGAITYIQLLEKLAKVNKELDVQYTTRHFAPCECFNSIEFEEDTEWNDTTNDEAIKEVEKEIRQICI